MSRLRAYLRRVLVSEGQGPQLVAAAPGVRVRDIFRRFWPDARAYRGWIALGLVFAVIVPAIETVEIWMFKLVVDEVLVPGDLGPLAWIALAYVGLTPLVEPGASAAATRRGSAPGAAAHARTRRSGDRSRR